MRKSQISRPARPSTLGKYLKSPLAAFCRKKKAVSPSAKYRTYAGFMSMSIA
jgi:hypothetical protein